jgi:xanthine dehydrogenase large subunit
MRIGTGNLQDPSRVAKSVCAVLGLPQTLVEVRMERAGGGYGGKGTRSVPAAAAAAVATVLTGRPVRVALPLAKNLEMLGSRKPHR